MKKVNVLLFYCTSLLFLVNTAFSQNRAFQWDIHGIGFEVASDFTVLENEYSLFTAMSSDGALIISISPWQDANLTLNNIADGTYSAANSMLGGIEFMGGDMMSVDYFKGYYMVAGVKDPEIPQHYAVIAILMDTLSSTNFAVAILYDKVNEQEAFNMLFSFYAYD